jgi:uncharacterized protein YegL
LTSEKIAMQPPLTQQQTWPSALQRFQFMPRRLPVYILADCSGSMAGSPIESVKSGIRALHSELMGDPSAVETAYLSVITFASSAQQAVPLTEVVQFVPPDLQAGGLTALGEALGLLLDRMKQELRTTTQEQKGDWRPLIFILTDGLPTDSWERAADELKRGKSGNIIAVACGEQGAQAAETLKRVGNTVLVMKEMTPDSFKQFFKWVSASVAQTSQRVGSSLTPGPVDLPPPPPQITIVP